MRTRRVTARTALAAVICTVALIGGTTTPASAASGTALPSASYRDLVVDDVHDRVFISDPSGSSVVVTDYAGQVLKQITLENGAAGLAISPDSSTVYVALSSADAISAIDTGTLTETNRYQTGAGTSPQSLALADGKIWFSHGATGQAGIGSLELSGSGPVITLNQSSGWYYAPALASSPADPNMLVAGDHGLSPATLAVYDANADGLQQRVQRTFYDAPSMSDLNDFAVTPDGRNIVTANGTPYRHQVVSTSDLTENGSYPTDAYPNAVAIAPDGTVAAGGNGSLLYVFRAGASAPLRTYSPGLQFAAGLAWAADDNLLFAVTGDYLGAQPTLHVLVDAGKAQSALTLQAPSTAVKGNPLHVTGTLSANDPFGSGTTVEVTATDARTPGGVSIGSFPVAADGTFQFTARPRVTGQVTYTVRYTGDDQHTGATAQVTVEVTK
ncbi:YncE family protein [Streptomyces sp. NPDC102274]|uniref:YncE family protein n=1 Tax=Streptomyces sp. NPDC102274 TaxID=3366151 RepID=UPI00382E3BE7